MGESDEKDDCGGFCVGNPASAAERGSGRLLRAPDWKGEEGLSGSRRDVDHEPTDLPAVLEQIAARNNEGAGALKEEFGHALVPLSLPRLRRLVPLSIGLSAQLLR